MSKITDLKSIRYLQIIQIITILNHLLKFYDNEVNRCVVEYIWKEVF
jgi:hypothetical protein